MKLKGKYIPIISGFLIFIGYVYNHSFYSRFGIDIASYFTTGELILSFLPLVFPIIITVATLFLFFLLNLPIQAKRAREAKEAEEKGNEPEYINIPNIFKTTGYFLFHGPNRNEKIFPQVVKFLFNCIVVFSILFFAYQFVHPFFDDYTNHSGGSYYSPGGYVIACLIVFFSSRRVIAYLAKQSYYNLYNTEPGHIESSTNSNTEGDPKNDKSKIIKEEIAPGNDFKLSQQFNNVFTFVFLIGAIWVYGSYKAFLILENKPLYSVYIDVEGGSYQSNDQIVFVGQTKDYYFLKNLKQDEVIILHHKDIKKVKIKPIDKDNYFSPKNKEKKVSPARNTINSFKEKVNKWGEKRKEKTSN
jgi:hypothetical protein